MFLLGQAPETVNATGHSGDVYSIFAMCPGEAGVDAETLRRVFVAWLDRHPQNKHNLGETVLRAFQEAWPCKKSNYTPIP